MFSYKAGPTTFPFLFLEEEEFDNGILIQDIKGLASIPIEDSLLADGQNNSTSLNIKNIPVRASFTAPEQFHYYSFTVTATEENAQKPFVIVLADVPANSDYDILLSDGQNVYYDPVIGNGESEWYG